MKLYASLALALLATLSGTQCMPMRAYSNYRDTFRHSDANADVDSYEDMADSTRDMDANQDVYDLEEKRSQVLADMQQVLTDMHSHDRSEYSSEARDRIADYPGNAAYSAHRAYPSRSRLLSSHRPLPRPSNFFSHVNRAHYRLQNHRAFPRPLSYAEKLARSHLVTLKDTNHRSSPTPARAVHKAAAHNTREHTKAMVHKAEVKGEKPKVGKSPKVLVHKAEVESEKPKVGKSPKAQVHKAEVESEKPKVGKSPKAQVHKAEASDEVAQSNHFQIKDFEDGGAFWSSSTGHAANTVNVQQSNKVEDLGNKITMADLINDQDNDAEDTSAADQAQEESETEEETEAKDTSDTEEVKDASEANAAEVSSQQTVNSKAKVVAIHKSASSSSKSSVTSHKAKASAGASKVANVAHSHKAAPRPSTVHHHSLQAGQIHRARPSAFALARPVHRAYPRPYPRQPLTGDSLRQMVDSAYDNAENARLQQVLLQKLMMTRAQANAMNSDDLVDYDYEHMREREAEGPPMTEESMLSESDDTREEAEAAEHEHTAFDDLMSDTAW